MMVFYFNDPNKRFHSMVLDLENNTTILHMREKSPCMRYVIPHIFPDCNPSNALQLAERLKALLPFS